MSNSVHQKFQNEQCVHAPGGEAPFPCLNSNISTESSVSDEPETPSALAKLSTQHRKTAYILKSSVEQLSVKYGVEKLGFLTLTFSQHITDPKEAQKRFNSLVSHVIKKRYQEYLGVFERQKSGRIHYHLLVVLEEDVRTGIDFSEFENSDYKSAGRYLRGEWAFWRKTARRYGFGRTELLPVKSNIDAMAKYVGKYIGKHIESRKTEDKGVRLVRYSRGARVGTTRFMFNSGGSKDWRRKVATFAEIIGTREGITITELSELSAILGKRWAYNNREFILSLP